MSTVDDGYIMGRTTEEYQRLRSQARVWEPVTRRLLGQMDLRPEERILSPSQQTCFRVLTSSDLATYTAVSGS
jgi:hypothetical protein